VRGFALVLLVALVGCIGSIRESTTARTAQEELLCSTAAERAVGALDSRVFAGHRVWIDADRIEVQVERGYVLDAFEQRVAEAGGRLARTRDAADLVVEVRAAALGTYEGNWNIFIPTFYANAIAPTADAPPLLQIGYSLQEGWCRLDAFCIDTGTGKFVTGWRAAWGRAYVGFFDDIYPEQSIAQTVKGRLQ
jgi:hypothetical protein